MKKGIGYQRKPSRPLHSLIHTILFSLTFTSQIRVLRERKEGRREGEGCGCFTGRRPDRRGGAQGWKAAAERWSSGTDDGGAARKKEEDLASRRRAVPSAHNRTNGGGAAELPYEMKVLLALRWLDGAAGGCDGDDLHCGDRGRLSGGGEAVQRLHH
ncbi:putative eukaryotic translation initiation factor 3 subunit [Sesbania bispinosa]|nr:putative eukaryotic translation initiation factor 3 subunit [Sesbania bispinosa]